MARIYVGVLLLLVAMASDTIAQVGGHPNVGARPAALGQSFVAVADDAYAAYWNPAGLTSLTNHEVQSQYANLFGAQVNNTYLAYMIPFSDRLTAGVDWFHIGFGDSELSVGQNRIALSAGYKLTEWLSVGGNAKLFTLNSSLAGLANPTGFSSSGRGIGYDGGVLLEPKEGVRLGIMLRDIGDSKIKYDNGVSRTIYPMNVLWGVSYKYMDKLMVTTSLDRIASHFGAEYEIHPSAVVRGGMQRDFSNALGMDYAVGGGLRYKGGMLDYAYTVSPGLPATHRFSAGLAFDFSASAIKIDDVNINPLFPAYRHQYNQAPVGQVKLTNTSRKPLSANVRLFIPEAMDAPTELEEPVVVPPGAETVDLTALFGERFSEWPRNRILSAEIEVSYVDASKTRTSTKQSPVTIYKRNAMRWWDIGAAAAFIIPDDKVVGQFASASVLGQNETIASMPRPTRPLLRAMAIFDALSEHGVRYQLDPNTPYQQVSGKDFIIDSIQYPPEFLSKRTGDCDDCTVLYCSLLENVGVPTALVDAPGHILMAFDTGISSFDAEKIGLLRDRYIVRNDNIWIPIEVTLFGSSFQQAWDTAIAECRNLEAEGRLVIVDTKDAWHTYAPSAPAFDQVIAAPDADAVKAAFDQDRRSIETYQERFLSENYLDELSGNPDNTDIRNALIYNLVQIGQYNRALSELDVLAGQGIPAVDIENNRAIIYVRMGDLEQAERHFLAALAEVPGDAFIQGNLDYIRTRLGRIPAADNLAAGREDGANASRGADLEMDLSELHWRRNE